MKIRIKGNSVRIRLSKSEVEKLAGEGYLQDQTLFGDRTLIYAVQASSAVSELSAEFLENKITMFVAQALVNEWPANKTVGFNASMPVSEHEFLSLKLEKDFACIDVTTEDQSDHYENPNKYC